MKYPTDFKIRTLEEQYKKAQDLGYEFFTCLDYFNKKNVNKLTIVNRVDIDLSIGKAEKIREMFERLNIKASFFVRLHAPEYNVFSFENYRILKQIIHDGHEIGYHSEVVDQSAIWKEDASACLRRDIEVLERILEVKICGVASHGGMTGLNNLDFWRDFKPNDFNLSYEAYEDSSSFKLFTNSFYISDSEWTRWKCYSKGELQNNDKRSFGEHLDDKHKLIYLLVHPDTYFSNHFYE